jgi:hypothetical protein
MGSNGRTWWVLNGVHEIEVALGRMDGENLYSLVVWRLPDGKTWHNANPSKQAKEYLQCAGSADRMTVEVRRREGRSIAQYTAGRAPERTVPSELSERVAWGDHHLYVALHEVFDQKSAFELFDRYFHSGALPTDVTLRKLLNADA